MSLKNIDEILDELSFSKMTELEVYIPGKFSTTLEMATKWDELGDREMLFVSNAIVYNHNTAQVLCGLIELRAKAQRKKLPRGWKTLLNAEGAAMDALDLVNNLLKENNRTINPIKNVGPYYGPDDNFKDLVCGEFELAEPYFLLYNKTKDRQHLVMLAMMLWRLRNMDTRKRVPCTGEDGHLRSFSRQFKADTLQLVYIWYSGCRAMLPRRFPKVFSGGSEDSADKMPDLTAAAKLIHSGAGNRNGTREQIRATLLNEYLYDCQLLAEDNEELEEKLKKHRR